MRSFKLCVIITTIELYTFTPVLVTVIISRSWAHWGYQERSKCNWYFLSNLLFSQVQTVTYIDNIPHKMFFMTLACIKGDQRWLWKTKLIKPYKHLQSQVHVNNGLPLCFVASLMRVACLIVRIIQHWIFAFANPLWPCIKVNVIFGCLNECHFVCNKRSQLV